MTREEIQSIQKRIGAEPDGWWGPNSMESCQRHLRSLLPHPSPFPSPATEKMAEYYGPAGEVPLVQVPVPYRMRLYDEDKLVKAVTIHERLAPSLAGIFSDIIAVFPTPQDRDRAGVTKFFGSFVNRPQRGGTRPSKHAFGAAIDLDATRNGLHTPWPTKSAMPLEVFEVFARRGWVGLGWLIWRDAMHFQATQ